MTHSSTLRRRLSALAGAALVASLLATAALPAVAVGHAIATSTPTLDTPENGTATFDVTLSEEPTADVTVSVVSSDTGVATVGPGSLTFTAANYAVAQEVTVSGVDNTVTDGDAAVTVNLEATSDDVAYQGRVGSVAVTRVDDEVPGITAVPTSGLATGEDGTTDTFTVVLDEEPTGTVTVTVASNDPDEATADKTELTFLTTDWNVEQTVTVAGVDDDVVDGSAGFSFTLTASNTGGYSDGVTESVTGSNTDDDSASTIVTAPGDGLATDEAGTTDTFSVRLGSEPTADVVITLTSSDTSEATLAPEELTFTPANWNTPQDVTVTGVDDAAVDGAIAFTISGVAASADTDYDGLTTANVPGTNADNDVSPPPAGDDTGNENETTFDDLGSLSDETINAINTLVALEITQGTSATTFSPNEVVSRWQMALFLTRQLVAHSVTLPTAAEYEFTDLDGLDAETRNAIAQLAALDVTSGTASDTYSPDAGVTRWQMALFMTRVLVAAGVELPTTTSGEFDDIGDLSPEAQLAIQQLASLGVVLGIGDGAFDPTAEIPRWQMALFIVRTLEAAGVSTS